MPRSLLTLQAVGVRWPDRPCPVGPHGLAWAHPTSRALGSSVCTLVPFPYGEIACRYFLGDTQPPFSSSSGVSWHSARPKFPEAMLLFSNLSSPPWSFEAFLCRGWFPSPSSCASRENVTPVSPSFPKPSPRRCLSWSSRHVVGSAALGLSSCQLFRGKSGSPTLLVGSALSRGESHGALCLLASTIPKLTQTPCSLHVPDPSLTSQHVH